MELGFEGNSPKHGNTKVKVDVPCYVDEPNGYKANIGKLAHPRSREVLHGWSLSPSVPRWIQQALKVNQQIPPTKRSPTAPCLQILTFFGASGKPLQLESSGWDISLSLSLSFPPYDFLFSLSLSPSLFLSLFRNLFKSVYLLQYCLPSC